MNFEHLGDGDSDRPPTSEEWEEFNRRDPEGSEKLTMAIIEALTSTDDKKETENE